MKWFWYYYRLVVKEQVVCHWHSPIDAQAYKHVCCISIEQCCLYCWDLFWLFFSWVLLGSITEPMSPEIKEEHEKKWTPLVHAMAILPLCIHVSEKLVVLLYWYTWYWGTEYEYSVYWKKDVEVFVSDFQTTFKVFFKMFSVKMKAKKCSHCPTYLVARSSNHQ